MKKKLSLLFILVVSLFPSLMGAVKQYADTPETFAGGPGISITNGTASKVSPNGTVSVNVKVHANYGDLTQDGKVVVTVPANIVANNNDLKKVNVGDPFLPDQVSVTRVGDNYEVAIPYDHTKANAAINTTITIQFGVVYYTDKSPISALGSINIDAKLEEADGNVIGPKSAEVPVEPGKKPKYILLNKWGSGSEPNQLPDSASKKTWLLSTKHPEKNVFKISVNWNNERDFKNLVLTDTFDPGVKLIKANNYIPAKEAENPTEDQDYKGIQVAKVTQRDDTGKPLKYRYVTNEFAQDGRITVTDNSYSVNFGDVAEADSYIVIYGQEAVGPTSPAEFGIKNNTATLTENGNQVATRNEVMALDSKDFATTILRKDLVAKNVDPRKGTIDYRLTLSTNGINVPAGAKVDDLLQEHLNVIDGTVTYGPGGYFDSFEKTDENGREKLSFTLKKQLNDGEFTTIDFQVKYDNPNGKATDVIKNKADLVIDGDVSTSNEVVVHLGGQIKIKKRNDEEPVKYLPNAVFQILDANGNVVQDDLVTDENGEITSQYLEIGNYTLVEKTPPPGYEISTQPIPFTIGALDEVVPVEVQNKRIIKPSTISKEIKTGVLGPNAPHTGEIADGNITYQGNIFVADNLETLEYFKFIDHLDPRTTYVGIRFYDEAGNQLPESDFQVQYANNTVTATCTNNQYMGKTIKYELDVKFTEDIYSDFTPIRNQSELERKVKENKDPEHVVSPEITEITHKVIEPTPNGDGSVTLPGADGDLKGQPDNPVVSPLPGQPSTITPNANGGVDVPDGGVVTFPNGNGGVSTQVPAGSQVKPDGTIVTPNGEVQPMPEGTIILPGKDNDITNRPDNPIVAPNPSTDGTPDAIVNDNGTVTLPNGGAINIGPNNPPIQIPNGSTVNPDGSVNFTPENDPNNPTQIMPNSQGGITVPGVDKDLSTPGDNVTINAAPDGTVPTIDADGNVIVPNGATVTTPNGEVTPPNGSKVNQDGDIIFPNGTVLKPDGTIIVPGDDGQVGTGNDDATVTPNGDPVFDENGTPTLPNGGTVTPQNPDGTPGTPTTVPNNSVVNPDATVTVPGKDNQPVTVKPQPDGTIMLPGKDNDIKQPEDNPIVNGDLELNEDGTVSMPNGGTINIGPNNPPITIPNGSTVNPDGAVEFTPENDPNNPAQIMPNQQGGVTVPGVDKDLSTPEDNVTINPGPDGTVPTINPDGTVTVPNGATVTTPNGDVTPPNGSKVNQDGDIIFPNGTVVKPDGTIIVPGDDQVLGTGNDDATVKPNGDVTFDQDGVPTLPNGGTITPQNPDGTPGLPTTLPNNSTVNPDATVTLPGKDNKPVTVKPQPDGTIMLPGEDGDVSKPEDNPIVEGNPVLNEDGTVSLPNGGTVSIGKDNPPIVVPEGSTINPSGSVEFKPQNNPNSTAQIMPNKEGGITVPGVDNDLSTPGDNVTINPGPDGTVPTIDADGNVVVPDGATVTTPNGDVTPPSGSVVNQAGDIIFPNGTVVKPDGSIIVPGDDHVVGTGNDDATIKPNGDVTIDKDGNVSLPNGGTITPQNPDGTPGVSTTLPNNTDINLDGSVVVNNTTLKPTGSGIILPGEDGTLTDDKDNVSVEVPAGSTVTVDKEGIVTMPDGGKVTLPNSPDSHTINVPAGSQVKPDGTMIVGKNEYIQKPDGTIIVPGADGKIDGNGDGVVTTTGDVTINEDGTMILHGGGTLTLSPECILTIEVNGILFPDGSIINPGANGVIDTTFSRVIAMGDDEYINPAVACAIAPAPQAPAPESPVINVTSQVPGAPAAIATGVKGIIVELSMMIVVAVASLLINRQRR